MTYSLVAHLAQASTNGNGFTSNSIDTSTADLLVVIVSDTNGSTTLSDSKNNTWTVATSNTSIAPSNTIFYAKNAISGTLHTFTLTGTSTAPAFCMLAFKGSASVPIDQTNNAFGFNVATLQPGSVTPSQGNEVIVTGVSDGDTTANALSIDSSFTITDQLASTANSEGVGAAYLIQTNAVAVNPTWSDANSKLTTATIASFKVASGAPVLTFISIPSGSTDDIGDW